MKEENRNLQTVVQENYRSILRQAVAVIEDIDVFDLDGTIVNMLLR